jgi:hypothetical protein
MALLYVRCEGDDDELFFDEVVQPRLSYANHEVKYFQYAEYPAEEVRNLIRSVNGMRSDGVDADYLFLRDYDQAPCKTSRFDAIDRTYDELVARDRTFLVVQMIEGWYVAGLENQHSLPMLDDAPPQTDDLLKRDFETMMAEDADRPDVLQEILKVFDVDRARYKNNSFEYFCSAILD